MSAVDMGELEGLVLGVFAVAALFGFIAWHARKSPPPWVGPPEDDEEHAREHGDEEE